MLACVLCVLCLCVLCPCVLCPCVLCVVWGRARRTGCGSRCQPFAALLVDFVLGQIGELIGGSQREDNYDLLLQR